MPAQWTQPLPAAAPGAPGSAAAPDLQGWWKAWGDESLNTLVEEALAANLDLSQAQSRLRQQRLLAGTAGAAFRPVFTAGARTLQDIAAIDSYFHASIDVSWDLGLFGAREAGERNAAAAVLDARGRLQAARVALVADVVHRYLDIRMAQRQLALIDEQAQLDARALQLAQVRQQQRLGTAEAVRQLQLQAGQSAALRAGLRETRPAAPTCWPHCWAAHGPMRNGCRPMRQRRCLARRRWAWRSFRPTCCARAPTSRWRRPAWNAPQPSRALRKRRCTRAS